MSSHTVEVTYNPEINYTFKLISRLIDIIGLIKRRVSKLTSMRPRLIDVAQDMDTTVSVTLFW